MKIKTSLLAVCALIAAVGFVACAKKITGEAPETTKARKTAIYAAQTYVGLESWSDATEILANGTQTNATAAKTSYQINEKTRQVLDEAVVFVKQGKPKDALDAVDRGLRAVESAETSGVIQFKTAAAQQEFVLILAGVRAAFESIRAAIESTKEPEFAEEARARARAQEPVTAAWWVQLVRLGSTTYSRLFRLSRVTNPDDAWAEAQRVSGTLASKNATRLTN